MWCHICKIDFTEHELFKRHILEKHRPDSALYKGSDTNKEESDEQETTVVSDTEMQNADGDSTESSVDVEHSSDILTDEPVSKSSTSFSSNNQLTYGLRRSNRVKKAVNKSNIFYSQKISDANGNKRCKKAKISKFASNQDYNPNPVASESVVLQQPVLVNAFNSNISQLNNYGGFELNSKNILEWLIKHKNLCENLSYPLPPHLYKKIILIHKGLISRYSTASPNEGNSAIFEVYEDISNMILKHIESVHNLL